MKKLNNKGTSLVELVITFAILMILVVGMLELIMNLKNDASSKAFGKKMMEYRSNITELIESDLIRLKYSYLTDDCSLTEYEKSNVIVCKNLHFKDGTVNELKINLTTKIIRYHNLNYDIPNSDFIEFLDNRVYAQNPLNSSLDVTIVDKNNMLIINVPYFEIDQKDNYGFKIVYPKR